MSDMSDTSDTHSDSYKTEIVFKVTVPGHDTAPVGVVEKDYINQLQDWSKIYFGQHKELSYNIDVVSNKMTAPPSGYDSEDEEIPGLIPFTQEEIDHINNPPQEKEEISGPSGSKNNPIVISDVNVDVVQETGEKIVLTPDYATG